MNSIFNNQYTAILLKPDTFTVSHNEHIAVNFKFPEKQLSSLNKTITITDFFRCYKTDIETVSHIFNQHFFLLFPKYSIYEKHDIDLEQSIKNNLLNLVVQKHVICVPKFKEHIELEDIQELNSPYKKFIIQHKRKNYSKADITISQGTPMLGTDPYLFYDIYHEIFNHIKANNFNLTLEQQTKLNSNKNRPNKVKI